MNLNTDFAALQKLTQNESDLNIKHKTIKLLGDDIGQNLDDLGFGKDF